MPSDDLMMTCVACIDYCRACRMQYTVIMVYQLNVVLVAGCSSLLLLPS